VQLSRFLDFILQYIFVQVVKSPSWAKGRLMVKSHEIIVIYVRILFDPIHVLGSNHQLRSRGPTMFAINVQFGMI